MLCFRPIYLDKMMAMVASWKPQPSGRQWKHQDRWPHRNLALFLQGRMWCLRFQSRHQGRFRQGIGMRWEGGSFFNRQWDTMVQSKYSRYFKHEWITSYWQYYWGTFVLIIIPSHLVSQMHHCDVTGDKAFWASPCWWWPTRGCRDGRSSGGRWSWRLGGWRLGGSMARPRWSPPWSHSSDSDWER